uniref:Uncharacterized protein n=1 Tax=Neolamprologus brichardi TaxID=32507 RepID=A0A3Q4H5Q7_NEOBR
FCKQLQNDFKRLQLELVSEWINLNLNTTENVLHIFKSQVCAKKPTILNKLYQIYQDEWRNIQPELCQKLIRENRN